jgi:toxin ParE1/3/4
MKIVSLEVAAVTEPGLGLRFVREVRASLERIADNPLMYPVIEQDMRRALLHKFPYSVYFVNESDAVSVVAVLHQHRQPGHWKSRQ